MISKIDSEMKNNKKPHLTRESILEYFNMIDYLFFKGYFDETKSIWSLITEESIIKHNLSNYYQFYKIRENLNIKNIEKSKEFLASEYDFISNKMSNDSILSIFRYEVKFYEGFGQDFFHEFTRNASIIPYNDNYPMEAKIHFLTMGAIIILKAGGNPYSALQYAQLASSLSNKLINKDYWYAWTSSIEAKAAFFIGDLKFSYFKAQNSMDIFSSTQTGDYLGKQTTLEVLSQIAELQGNFDEAVNFSMYGLQKTNKMDTIIRLIDLYFQIGNLDQVHKWIYEGKVELINSHKVMSTRLKIRELQLLLEEDGRKLAEDQLKLILDQKNIDNYLKTKCLRLLCNIRASIKDYEKSRKWGIEAYAIAKLENNPLEILKSLILLLNITLQQTIEENLHQDKDIEKWLSKAFLLASKRNARLFLIELEMYDVFHKILFNKFETSLKEKLIVIQNQCIAIHWFRGELLVTKLISLIELDLLDKLQKEKDINEEKDSNVTSKDALDYLNELKNLSKGIKF